MTIDFDRAPAERVMAGNSQAAATARHSAFVHAYLQNGHNATQAAISAGYSEKTARSQGQRLLTNVDVQRELAREAHAVAEATGIETERTLRELVRIAYANPRRLVAPDGRMKRLADLDDDVAGALAAVKLDEDGRILDYRFWSKVEALNAAMKHLGLFERDNVQKGENLQVQVLVAAPVREPRPD